MTSFSQKNLSVVLNTFDNIMVNGAFKGANASFTIIFLNTLYFKGIKRHDCGVKG